MERLRNILHTIDEALSTKRKRHIIGGTLMGISLFFGVLAFTAVSSKMEDTV